MKTELEKLQEKIENLKAIQARCIHVWYEPERDIMKEQVTEVEPTGNVRVLGIKTVSCWSRECAKCGKKEYSRRLIDMPVVDELRSKSSK